ncbi:MAG: MBL fold metallo-hydrolase [Clostridiales Family XIII bacterium]|jgi:beta-lactamase superfamily II metal-dependent hydrolase|nr:MBL fold metallo-hydrolase [Clostridiales Family XIII bacterium]
MRTIANEKRAHRGKAIAFVVALAMLLSLAAYSPLNLATGNGDGSAYAASSAVNMRVHGIFLGSQAANADEPEDAQGDATLIESNGKFLLIDTGSATGSTWLLSYLKKVGATNIDILISHMHEDHYGGLNAILKKDSGITVGMIYLPSQTYAPELASSNATRFERVEGYVDRMMVTTDKFTTDRAVGRWQVTTSSITELTTRASILEPDSGTDVTYAAIYYPTTSSITTTSSGANATSESTYTTEVNTTDYECITGASLDAPSTPGAIGPIEVTDSAIETIVTRTAITDYREDKWIYTKNYIMERTTDTKYLKMGYSFAVGNANIKVIGPVGTHSISQFASQDGITGSKENHYMNNYSLSLMITAGSRRYFTGGDIESAEEKMLVKKYGASLKADVMKLSHHGLRTSTTADFMAAVSPTYTYVPNSGHQGYGSGSLRYLYVHNARVTASKYGFVYLLGNEMKDLIIDFSDARIDIRKSSAENAPLSGWVEVWGGYSQYWKTDKYYIDPWTGIPATGYFDDQSKHYYLGSGGCMEKAYYNSNGSYKYWRAYSGEGTRYYDKSGRFYTGFKTISKDRYLFTSKGFRTTQIGKYNGKYYAFDSSGRMYRSKKVKIGGYTLKVAKNGTVTLPRPQTARSIGLSKYGGGRLKFTYAQNKMEDANGYVVQYSTSKKFKNPGSKQVAEALNKAKTKASSKKSVVITGLKKGKAYYVRVRAYRVYGNYTIYGKYSKVMKARA